MKKLKRPDNFLIEGADDVLNVTVAPGNKHVVFSDEDGDSFCLFVKSKNLSDLIKHLQKVSAFIEQENN